MKRIFLPPVLSLAVVATVEMVAQPSPAPSNSPAPFANTKTDLLVATPSPSPTAAIEPPSLVPDNILPPKNALPKMPNTPDLAALSAFFKQSSLGKEADEQRLHLETSKLEVQIRNDPELHQIRAEAMRQRTDLDRRHWLRTYYQAYYKKLRNLATTPELKARLNVEQANWELSLLQPRTRHETDEAAAKAIGQASTGASAPPALPTPVQAKAGQVLRH